MDAIIEKGLANYAERESPQRVFAAGVKKLEERCAGGWQWGRPREAHFRFDVTGNREVDRNFNVQYGREIDRKEGLIHEDLLRMLGGGFGFVPPEKNDPYEDQLKTMEFRAFTDRPGDLAKLLLEKVGPCELVDLPKSEDLDGKTLEQLGYDAQSSLGKRFGSGSRVVAAVTDRGWGPDLKSTRGRELRPWEILIVPTEDSSFAKNVRGAAATPGNRYPWANDYLQYLESRTPLVLDVIYRYSDGKQGFEIFLEEPTISTGGGRAGSANEGWYGLSDSVHEEKQLVWFPLPEKTAA